MSVLINLHHPILYGGYHCAMCKLCFCFLVTESSVVFQNSNSICSIC
uniref:Uncharacterized protein n=1 Tax=Arundo donax TaxID=35708 RepID=A0A0A8YS47_ARUDO